MARCKARTLRGRRCKAHALKGGQRCMFHSTRNIALQAGGLYVAKNIGPITGQGAKVAWQTRHWWN